MRSSANRIKPAFVFSGAGPQWWGMGHELLDHEPVFARMAEKCDAVFQRVAGWSILAEMSAPEHQSLVDCAHIVPSANFILQTALCALWRDEGIEPGAAIGHSSGEVAAAHVAGVLSLEDAIRISYRLGRLHAKRAGKGTMLAVGLNGEQARSVLASGGFAATVAAVNSPSAVTLSGDPNELERIAATLDAADVFNRFLHVDVAYHSPSMEPFKAELRAALNDVQTGVASIPLYSTVTGRRAGKQPWNADYWCHNLRDVVQFEGAVDGMIEDGHRTFVEIGAHPVLSTSIRECLADRGVNGIVLPSLRRGQPERVTFFGSLERLRPAAYSSHPMLRSSPSGRMGHAAAMAAR